VREIILIDPAKMKDIARDFIRRMDKDEFKPDVIIGIARGGLYLGLMLSYYYGIEMIAYEPKKIKDFDHFKEKFGKLPYDRPMRLDPDWKLNDKNVLVTENIIVTGKTLKLVTSYISKQFTTANIKTCSVTQEAVPSKRIFTSDYHAIDIDTTNYPIFEYENWWKGNND
jgi:hypoxanthine phosphoribosyltransferase